MKTREKIISDYIEGYNSFDIYKMIADFDEGIEFKSISNGEINLSLSGIGAFKEQAEQAKNYFTYRVQTIESFKHHNDETIIEVDYSAVLAMDFPNGLKKGDALKLKGKSIFRFSGDRIIELTDIS